MTTRYNHISDYFCSVFSYGGGYMTFNELPIDPTLRERLRTAAVQYRDSSRRVEAVDQYGRSCPYNVPEINNLGTIQPVFDGLACGWDRKGPAWDKHMLSWFMDEIISSIIEDRHDLDCLEFDITPEGGVTVVAGVDFDWSYTAEIPALAP